MNMAKDSVVAVRLEKHLVELLKEQTIIWGTATLSGTLRELIKMFFAPVLSQEEFDKEIKRFIVFLREVQEKGLRSMEYISEALEDYEEMEQREKEFKDRWQRARIEK
jgi:hypothetical protein